MKNNLLVKIEVVERVSKNGKTYEVVLITFPNGLEKLCFNDFNDTDKFLIRQLVESMK